MDTHNMVTLMMHTNDGTRFMLLDTHLLDPSMFSSLENSSVLFGGEGYDTYCDPAIFHKFSMSTETSYADRVLGMQEHDRLNGYIRPKPPGICAHYDCTNRKPRDAPLCVHNRCRFHCTNPLLENAGL